MFVAFLTNVNTQQKLITGRKKNNFAWHFFKLDLLCFLYLSFNVYFSLCKRDKQGGNGGNRIKKEETGLSRNGRTSTTKISETNF